MEKIKTFIGIFAKGAIFSLGILCTYFVVMAWTDPSRDISTVTNTDTLTSSRWNEIVNRVTHIYRDDADSSLEIDGAIRADAKYCAVSDGARKSTTSTSAVFEPNLICTLDVKAGDIIQVQLEGNFNLEGDIADDFLFAYPDVYAGDVSSLSVSNNTHIRLGNISGPIIPASTTRYYKANADTTAQFAMKWRMNGTNAKVAYRSIKAIVIGKE